MAAVARALRCDVDERDHLFHLAGLTPPPRRAGRHIPPGLLRLVDHLTDVPALVLSDLTEVLWQNRLADALNGPLAPEPRRANNAAWRWFTDPARRELCPPEDRARLSVSHVRDLRAVWSRRGADADVTALVSDLCTASTEFAALWERHEVAESRDAGAFASGWGIGSSTTCDPRVGDGGGGSGDRHPGHDGGRLR